jgi:hypothetical protein
MTDDLWWRLSDRLLVGVGCLTALVPADALDADGNARRAAFGDRPEADLWASARHGSARERWLTAVAFGGSGKYAAAAGLLRPLIAGPDPLLAALAGATLAAHRRQLGAHEAARRLDSAALARLAPLGPPGEADRGDPDDIDLGGAWSDALLGLAADAVGLGRVGEARRLHSAAQRVTGGWRTRIRAGWVAAEIELAASRPDQAVHWAEQAAARARSAPSTRHRVKSALVLSAAVLAADTTVGRDRAGQLLQEALGVSLSRGIFSLSWPCALLLAELAPERAQENHKIASYALTCCFVGSDREMQRLAQASPWVPTHLVRFGEPTRTSGWSVS